MRLSHFPAAGHHTGHQDGSGGKNRAVRLTHASPWARAFSQTQKARWKSSLLWVIILNIKNWKKRWADPWFPKSLIIRAPRALGNCLCWKCWFRGWEEIRNLGFLVGTSSDCYHQTGRIKSDSFLDFWVRWSWVWVHALRLYVRQRASYITFLNRDAFLCGNGVGNLLTAKHSCDV